MNDVEGLEVGVELGGSAWINCVSARVIVGRKSAGSGCECEIRV